MIITELEGFEFDLETRNCFHLLQDFYRLNYNIELNDYPCPGHWWNHGLDLYRELSMQEGFAPIHSHPSEWRTGDVILMAINAPVGNHVAILLPDGKILHHLIGQRSCVTSYGGLFRNSTVAVYRHREVSEPEPTQSVVDIRSLLSPHVLRRLENRRAQEEAARTSE